MRGLRPRSPSTSTHTRRRPFLGAAMHENPSKDRAVKADSSGKRNHAQPLLQLSEAIRTQPSADTCRNSGSRQPAITIRDLSTGAAEVQACV
ncbi:hypothetical protein NDU88_003058 [Pleurodeles waltl]|uniref:Uncharacterized protein n=1 Tax=Pleurodeles waltl TaxID=8319 RepID=A0AAV7M3A5_PLEWA|nr:hypothetical protein NDU88_003058 [Pleurodeles waltl]